MKRFSIPSTLLLPNEEKVLNSNFKKVKLYIQSDGVNYNGSSFSLESMKDAMSSIHYIPILGYVKNVDDVYDFDGHNVSYDIHVDNNGNTSITENYEEVPIGVVTNECYIEKVDDKNFLVAYGYIWKCYSNKGIEILERDMEKEVSMEISVEDGEFTDDGIYAISKYEIMGVTVLGQDVPAAIEGSKIQMSFSNNKEYQDKVNEIDLLLQKFLKGGESEMDNEKEFEVEEEVKEDFAEEPIEEKEENPDDEPQEEFAEEDKEEEEEKEEPKKEEHSIEEPVEEKLYSQAEMDEAIANAKAEFSEALVELAELREFKAEYDRKIELQRLNNEMDELVKNFNVEEEKVNELKEKVINGEFSMEKFELELYRNDRPVEKTFSKKEDKSTSLPIVDVEEKMSEVDKLFAKYGIAKRK